MTPICASGWQAQPGSRTVQGVVEQAVSTVANHPVGVVCAGRTDSGVHAVGQVIHFDTHAERRPRSWALGCNVNLPRDVTVLWARPVAEDFHARFGAVRRSYRYAILNRMTRPAVLRDRVCWHHQPLDVAPMALAGAHLEGEHDFSSFRALSCQARHPVRTIYSLSVKRAGDFVYIDVTANAFLHHMVRNIAGVLMAVGAGERPPRWTRQLLEARDRTVGGVTAPPGGLYLVSVTYPRSHDLPPGPALPTFS
ncbi:MAG: tRNA pseudouridine(38-40) synthase TruA [Gammaproteobacteria bacterium]